MQMKKSTKTRTKVNFPVMRATISGKRSTLPAKRQYPGKPAPLLVLCNKDGCLASKNTKNYNAKSEFRSKKTITDIDMLKDMLQIISWITNVPRILVSSVVSRQLKITAYCHPSCCTPKENLLYIYITI